MVGAVCPVAALFILATTLGEADLRRDPSRMRYWVATRDAEAIAKTLDRYKTDCGVYPDTRKGLNALLFDDGSTGWNGPYLTRPPVDRWGRPYLYFLSDGSPEIVSYAADGKPGGAFFNADISSRHLQYSMPESPYERRIRLEFLGWWVGAWLWLIGSAFVFSKTLRKLARNFLGRRLNRIMRT